MPEIFIKKIKGIILENIRDEKFGVSELAARMGLSRSQLLRKVKTSAGVSANQFIRDIRLEEATRLLKDDELTVSEIAYEVGFSSPSYFNKCFHDRYGFTPGDFKKNGNETYPVTGNVPEGFLAKLSGRSWTIIVSLAVVLSISVYFIQGSVDVGKMETKEISIAVLPFLDLSEKQNRSHVAMGLTDNLITELSKIKGFRVISRGSAMIFRDSIRIYSEIAEYLGADLLLEGSVLTDEDSMLVNVQLIDPFPREKHIWADKYFQQSTRILEVVNSLSNNIAHKILNAAFPAQSNEAPEVNAKAYDLYQKGRMLWMTQDIRQDKLQDAINYLTASISIDSNFAPAYLTLAECYLALDRLVYDHEQEIVYRKNARRAVNKAIELDNSLAAAYTTKANLVGKLDWDWEQMKFYAEKALQLQPSNSDAHLLLSNYYTVKGDYGKTIKEALLAKSLDPINPRTLSFLAERYYIVGEYEKSIQTYQEVLELFPTFGFAMHGLGYVYLQQGEAEKTIEIWTELQDLMRNKPVAAFYRTGAPFEECVKFYMKGAMIGEEKYCCNQAVVSSLFMMIDDYEGTLEYFRIAFDVQNEDLPFVLSYPLYYPLHGNPEFQAIVKKVGVILPQSNPG